MELEEHVDTDAEAQDYSHSESDGIADLEAEGELSPPKPKKPRKLAGAATYKTKFKDVWKKELPFITSVRGDPSRFRCNICDKKIKCDHMGKQDVEKHWKTQGHQDLAKSLKSQLKLRFNAPQSSETLKRTEAEL